MLHQCCDFRGSARGTEQSFTKHTQLTRDMIPQHSIQEKEGRNTPGEHRGRELSHSGHRRQLLENSWRGCEVYVQKFVRQEMRNVLGISNALQGGAHRLRNYCYIPLFIDPSGPLEFSMFAQWISNLTKLVGQVLDVVTDNGTKLRGAKDEPKAEATGPGLEPGSSTLVATLYLTHSRPSEVRWTCPHTFKSQLCYLLYLYGQPVCFPICKMGNVTGPRMKWIHTCYALRGGEGQGGLECCSPCGRNERLNDNVHRTVCLTSSVKHISFLSSLSRYPGVWSFQFLFVEHLGLLGRLCRLLERGLLKSGNRCLNDFVLGCDIHSSCQLELSLKFAQVPVLK